MRFSWIMRESGALIDSRWVVLPRYIICANYQSVVKAFIEVWLIFVLPKVSVTGIYLGFAIVGPHLQLYNQ